MAHIWLTKYIINSDNLNYGHASFELVHVTMDDTSNSIYLNGALTPGGGEGRWWAFESKTKMAGHARVSGSVFFRMAASTSTLISVGNESDVSRLGIYTRMHHDGSSQQQIVDNMNPTVVKLSHQIEFVFRWLAGLPYDLRDSSIVS